MRLWSLDPSFLDAKGLVALWREALLAQHVLHGKTKGYINHPQLHRFKEAESPKDAISAYLFFVHEEAARRGYNFDKKKIMTKPVHAKIKVTRGQMEFELLHLKKKLKERDKNKLAEINKLEPRAHKLFKVIEGDVEDWERV
jgi:hypothetical protein